MSKSKEVSTVIGMTSNMIFCPYPPVITAKDGTRFQPIRLYDVASRDKGILRTNPDGSRQVYADALYASAPLTEKHTRQMYRAYENALRRKHRTTEK